MAPFSSDRRLLLTALLVPFEGLVRATPAMAQSGATLPPIVQPSEKTKAGFLARARALRDQAVKEGDQAYGAVVVKGLQAHIDFLPTERRVVWTVINYGGNLLALAAAVIAAGGNISIGIGDYTYPELGHPTNAELVERVVAIARDVGREVATPEETKQMLEMR